MLICMDFAEVFVFCPQFFYVGYKHDNILVNLMAFYYREFHNKVPPDKMPLLCRKFCVINKPFTENIVYFCL